MSSMAHRIYALASEDPGRPALFGRASTGWRQLSRGAWWSSIRQAAGGMAGLGLAAGDVVLLWASTTPEWAVLAPAANLLGATVQLVDPKAGEDALVEAVITSEARWVVVDTSGRLERVLGLREAGAVELAQVVTFDRMDVPGERVMDLETLIERGASTSEGLEHLSVEGERVGLIAGRRQWTWRDLSQAAAPLAAQLDGVPLVVGCEALEGRALVAIAAAVEAGQELWLAPDYERLLDDLPSLNPKGLVLGECGWKRVRGRLERAADEIPGVRGGMAKVARQVVQGQSLPGLLKRVLEPAQRRVGVADAACWASGPVPLGIASGLSRLGVVVQPLP